MRLRNYLLSLTLFLTLLQCGGEDALSKSVGLSVIPNKPIIANSDIILPIPSSDSVMTVAAPSTVFGVVLSNNSGETLIVTGLRLESSYDFTDPVTGAVKPNTGTADISPASFATQEMTIKSVPGCTIAGGNCDQNYLAKLPSGTTDWTIRGFNSAGDEGNLRFYFSALPENDKKNFTYLMKLTILGYFGSETEVTSRVNKSIYFTTF